MYKNNRYNYQHYSYISHLLTKKERHQEEEEQEDKTEMERGEKEEKKEEENEEQKKEEEVQVILFQHRWTLLCSYLPLLTGRATGKGEGGGSETER